MAISRLQLNEEQLKQALDHCASEPIHIPGSIQPHGLLMVVSKDFIIEQISENAPDFIGVAAGDCLGKHLSEFLDVKALAPILKTSSEEALQPIHSIIVPIKNKDFNAVSHYSGHSLIIECEPIYDDEKPSGFYNDQLRNFAIGMHKAKSTQMVFDHVTEAVRKITGIDRVKLYRFDHDWHGEVVAESKAEHMPSYHGLHFPASDIPEQARRLYTQNYLRLIGNTKYRPVNIIPTLNPATHAPLDLSLSMLRSVSPIHVQYLENMNIYASLSISIIQNGKLWGLIACHHSKALYVPYIARNICEIMGHIFSAQLSTFEDNAKRQAQGKREELVKKLSSALDKNTRIDHLMRESHTLASEALNADGLVIKTLAHVLHYGQTPESDTIHTLIEWLGTRETESVFHTDDMTAYFKEKAGFENLKGGVLAVPISLKSRDTIMWFRNPLVQEVTWAGGPEKPVEETVAGYRLTPRSSFELWKETISQRAEPWLADDIKTAQSVVSILLESEKINAEQANLAKTEFLANISHEIRTPMNAVIGLARILADSKPLTERQKQFIHTLQISADGLLALINDMLDITKIESRNLELETIPFSFTSMLEEVISMMSVKALEKGIVFTLSQEGVNEKHFLGDPGRIRQILLNLCSNAVKFTDHGTIFIHVHCTDTEATHCKNIRLSVRDSGVGIPADKLESIFHKFVQADSSITRKFGGTGLGLAITKMLTEAMGGTIAVSSVEGQGSEFVVNFLLPLASDQPAPAQPHVMEFTPPVLNYSLLLVEDYEPNILVATIYLDNMGYQYDVARSGIEAVEKARSNNYAVIIMDVQMPGMNGFEATQMIREFEAQRGSSKTPIIGMTAHALAGDRERCLAAGMDDYIPKPVNQDELQSKLEFYCNQTHSQA